MRRITAIAAGALAAVAVAVPAASADMMPSAKLGAKQAGMKVVLTAKLTDFTIDADNVGKTNMAGKGHLHFQLDGGK